MKKYKNVTKAGDAIVFSRWSRKNYAVFQTLKRVVLISVLGVNYLYAVPVPKNNDIIISDTTGTEIEYKLEEIEVSAQRAPALFSEIARIVTVINIKEIAAAPVRTVQELLEYVAGADIRQRGSDGVQADISIRGGTFDQTLILLNGVNISDPQTGHHNLNIPVSFNQIERIEILEGPAARVYGPNAFSGAINIITKQPELNSFKANVTSGSFKYFETEVTGDFKTGKLNNSVSMNWKSSDGYIENTDFQNKGFFYTNSFENEAGQLRIQTGFSDKGFGANSFYTPKYPNQYEKVKALFTSAQWESKGKLHLKPVIYWRRHHDRFELFRENPPAWYTTHNYHLTNSYGTQLNSWIGWRLGKSAFGFEYRTENILSNVLGEPLGEPEPVPGEEAFFTKSKSRNIISGFAEHVYYANKWILSAGVMGNHISDGENGLNLFPGLEASYQTNRITRLFANFNTSLRMPTFTDLYYSGPTNIGNPDLKPELTAALEGGIKLNSPIVRGNFVMYYRKGKDVIDWVKTSVLDKWQPKNHTELNNYGTEIQVQSNLEQVLGNAWPGNISISYMFNTIEKGDFNFISYYVLDYLSHKLSFSVNKEVLKKFNFNFQGVYQKREGTYTEFSDNVWGEEVNYKPFWIFDTKLIYKIKAFQIFVSANNIFNCGYVDYGNIQQPGRVIKAGISVNANFD